MTIYSVCDKIYLSITSREGEMRRRKKNVGCTGSIFQIFVCLIAIIFIVALTSYAIGIIVIIGMVYILIRIIQWIIGFKSPLKNVNFDNMTGQEFENFCARVLRQNGFLRVTVTKGSGDHGIDILANKDGMKYAIQCKCYSGNVGNKAVQEAYSGKAIYRADIAVVMTNRYFTSQAEQDAKALNVRLWDRNKLQNLICFARDEKNINLIESKNKIKKETEI